MTQIGETIYSYVPKIFAIDKCVYGDYVIITIDKDGFISGWNINDEILNNIYSR